MFRLTSTAALVAAVLGGCGSLGDPATPCPSMDLGRARAATLVTPKSAPVVAVTAKQPFILHEVCASGDPNACELRKEPLEGLSQGSPVLLTSTGDFVIAIDRDRGTVNSYRISSVSNEAGRAIEKLPPTAQSDNRPRYLVASMRGNDYVVTRTADMELGRYYPGQTHAELIANDVENLRVAAVGERYLVGRQIHTGGLESLYLVPVHPDLPMSRPVRLLGGRTFSRVTLTPGDERIVATAGEGNNAETFVFSVPDGQLIDRFAGAVVSGRKANEEIPGLRNVSPDGSHLAYRTPTGTLAMRDLDIQASCLVRSSSAGDHRIAGFAPNGVLYMEAAASVGASRVLAYDPVTNDLVALGEAGHDYRLAAVAAQVPGQPEEGVDAGRSDMMHWAIAVEQGAYTAVSAHGVNKGLVLHDVSFMARDDSGVWLLDSFKDDEDRGSLTGEQTLAVRRIAPTVDGASLRFTEPADDHPEFAEPVSSNSSVCVSTGIPGAWAVRCSGGAPTTDFFSQNSGNTEDPKPGPADVPDPVVPDVDDDDDEDDE